MGRLPQPDAKNSSSCDDGQGPNPSCPPDDVPDPPLPYTLPPPSPASHGRSTFVTALIIAIPVLAFLALCLSIFIFVRRRRLRREALLEAALAPAAPATFPDDGDDGPGGEGEVVHHVWHIRTVGLDDAAIESITLTRYRAAAGGVLGASDCTVCLGEFQDGELLRLLPKCAHAFHVQCIDTWLRAHVSCPLCRADVMVDPAAAAAADAEQPPGADAADAASAELSASNTRTMEHERRHGQQANEQQQQELRLQIDQPDHSSSQELERPHRQIPRPGARARNFRRVVSMDSPSPPTASAEEAPEDEQAGGEKQGTGGAVCVCCEVSPEPGHQLNRPVMKRSLSASSRWTLLSRHCRTRSSLLPL